MPLLKSNPRRPFIAFCAILWVSFGNTHFIGVSRISTPSLSRSTIARLANSCTLSLQVCCAALSTEMPTKSALP
jgi:hypothetical protein